MTTQMEVISHILLLINQMEKKLDKIDERISRLESRMDERDNDLLELRSSIVSQKSGDLETFGFTYSSDDEIEQIL